MPHLAEPSGLLGVGGDLDPGRLLLAYRMGIFPWYNEDPILWWSPDPRMVLRPEELVVRRSLAKRIRQGRFTVRLDTAFEDVIVRCAARPRPGQAGTWITGAMAGAYQALFAQGHAHSVEVFDADGTLVGGVYGVAVGRLFSGESMFAEVSDASKVGFVHLVRQLARWGYGLIDCQVYTDHLAQFGAAEIPREDYLTELSRLAALPGRKSPWTFDEDFVCSG